MKYYLSALQKYAVFSGRSTRRDYWMFTLINMIVSVLLGFVLGFITGFIHMDLMWIYSIYTLALLIPGIALGVRRMHDTDRSGWWLIVPIAGLVFTCFKSDEEENRFGPVVKTD